MRRLLVTALALVLFAAPAAAAAKKPPGEPDKVPTAVGIGGAAATVDALATDAAVETLRKGGNAVDAAVAAAGVLGVTEPFSSGIGGGGFMVIRSPRGDVVTIDGRETAPAAMRPRSFFEGGAPLPFDAARYSGLSAGVPGTVATWDEAIDRYGTLSLRKALAPGVRVARRGFTVDQTFFDQTASNVDFFDDVPSTAEIYLDPDGTPRDVGTRLRNRDMARAYKRIARRGPDGFYDGPIAAAMAAAAQDPPIADDANHVWRPGDDRAGCRVSRRRGASRPGSATEASTSGAWGRRRAAARRSARRSTSSRAMSRSAPAGPRRCTASSRPRATRSPTGAPISPTPATSTCR